MKKLALLLAVAVAASAPTAAFAAKKKAAAKPPAAATDPNAAGKKFVREMWMQPVYAWQAAAKPVAKADAKPAKKAKKA